MKKVNPPSEFSKEARYLRAQKILRRRRWFYIHLAGYFVAFALILYNFYVLEEGPYKNPIITLNLSTIGAWTIIIIIHGIDVFRRKSFKKTWEDKKVEELLDKEKEAEKKTTLWE